MGKKKKRPKAIWGFKSYVAAPSNTKFWTQVGDGTTSKVTRSIALSSSSESLVKYYIMTMVVLHKATPEKLQSYVHLRTWVLTKLVKSEQPPWSISTLISWFWHINSAYVRCYHSGDWVKDAWGLRCAFFFFNFLWIYIILKKNYIESESLRKGSIEEVIYSKEDTYKSSYPAQIGVLLKGHNFHFVRVYLVLFWVHR